MDEANLDMLIDWVQEKMQSVDTDIEILQVSDAMLALIKEKIGDALICGIPVVGVHSLADTQVEAKCQKGEIIINEDFTMGQFV